MLERGVYLPPAQFEAAFVSLAHGEAEIDETVRAAAQAFRAARLSRVTQGADARLSARPGPAARAAARAFSRWIAFLYSRLRSCARRAGPRS